MLKVLFAFGTRPEAIKMAPVIAELRRRSSEFTFKVCVTAQHREMLDDVLDLFDINPDYDLDIMVEAQSPSHVTAAVHNKLEGILTDDRPDWLLVQGDTTTTMASAMTAFFSRVQVGHIEAGLRTGNKWQPFPEEVNRRVADLVADLHFAPTQRAHANLISEGVAPKDALVTGNTGIDALLDAAQRDFNPRGTALENLEGGRRLILLTCHRRESFGRPLQNICTAVAKIAQMYRDDVQIIYPVHPNPEVTVPVRDMLGDVPNILLLPPVDYLSLVQLMKRSYLILTDSGGIQEEAPSLGVPVLVLREMTERPEGVEAGAAKLVGSDETVIIAESTRLLEDSEEYERMSKVTNPYGDGGASARIADALLDRSNS